MSQSALSQSIKQLEDRMEVRLFERQKGDVRPTPFGDLAEEAARTALDAVDRMARETTLMRDLDAGTVSVGVDPFFTNAILAPVLSELLASHPKLRFSVRSGDQRTLQRRLLSGDIDLFFSLDPQADHPDIDLTEFELANAIVFCRPGHSLAGQKDVPLRRVLDFSIVSLALPPWFLEWARVQLTDPDASVDALVSISDEVILEADDINVVKTIIRNSDSISGGYPGDLAAEFERGELARLEIAEWPAKLRGVVGVERRRSLAPAAQQLMNLFLERVGPLSEGDLKQVRN